MLRLKLATLLILISSAAYAGPIPTDTGDYCKDQIIDYMRTQFGDEVEFYNWERMKQGRSGDYLYWFNSNVCDSEIYVTVPVSSGACKTVHYWYVPLHVHTIYAEGNCRDLIPRQRPIRHEDLSGCHRPGCMN